MSKKPEILVKNLDSQCHKCNGKGCAQCDNGVHRDRNYYFIVNGIAVDADNLK